MLEDDAAGAFAVPGLEWEMGGVEVQGSGSLRKEGFRLEYLQESHRKDLLPLSTLPLSYSQGEGQVPRSKSWAPRTIEMKE